MKLKDLITIVLVSLTIFSCKNNTNVDSKNNFTKDSIIVQLQKDDSEIEYLNKRVDTLSLKSKAFKRISDSLVKKNETLLKTNDSLTMVNKKLAQELLHNKLVIENAKYYLNITIKSPKQDKFLKGWMRRALNQ